MVRRHLLCGLLLLALAGEARGQRAPDAAADLAAADAFVGEVFAQGDRSRYAEASQTYLDMLARLDAGPALTDAEARLLRWHLQYLALVRPDDETVALADVLAAPGLTALPDGAGAVLVGWWRSQDHQAATYRNERVEEHLARIAHALATYPASDDPRGFDDRGAVYVRLGPPGRRREIRLEPAKYRTEAQRPRLPENELWLYPQLGETAHFLFVRPSRRRPYRLAEAVDLIPTQLRSGAREARLLLRVVDDVYGQLAVESRDYGSVYEAVAGAIGLPGRGGEWHQVALDVLGRAQVVDQQVAARRREAVPPSFTNVEAYLAPLAPAVRWARFLDADGSTRTEVYWGFPSVAALSDERQPRLLAASVAQRSGDHRTRRMHSKRELIGAASSAPLLGPPLVVRGDTATYRLALHWQLYALEPAPEGRWTPGDVLAAATGTAGPLDPLEARPDRLMLSDLSPGIERATGVRPYPFDELDGAEPLVLDVEIYHLTFDEAGESHYAVRAEVRGDRRRGRAAAAAVRTEHTGAARSQRERIRLDLSAWSGPVEVVVRVEDLVSGQLAERAIAMEVLR